MKRFMLSIGLVLTLLSTLTLLLHEITTPYSLGIVGFRANPKTYTWSHGHGFTLHPSITTVAIPLPPKRLLDREGVAFIELKISVLNETRSVKVYLLPRDAVEKLLGVRLNMVIEDNASIAQYLGSIMRLDAWLNTSRDILDRLSEYEIAEGYGTLTVRVKNTGEGGLCIIVAHGVGDVIVTPVVYRRLALHADPSTCSIVAIVGAALLVLGFILWRREAARIRELLV